MARTLTESKALGTTPRIRFNWGYWDGVYDARHNYLERTLMVAGGQLRAKLPQAGDAGSKAYRAGYAAGYRAVRDERDGLSEVPETSDAAWRAAAKKRVKR